MNYHLEIIKHLENKTFDLFLQWSSMQEDELQIEIMKAIEDVFTEMAIVNGKNPNEDKELQSLITRRIEFEKLSVLNKEAKEALKVIEERMSITGKKIEDHIEFSRDHIIEAIVNNMDHAPEMQELADKMIDFEKKTGTFDFNNWKEIL